MVEREKITEYPQIIPNLYVRSQIENLVLPSIDQLVIQSRKELKEAFGTDFEVPRPPGELFETLKDFVELGIKGFDKVYYQPEMKFKKDDNLWISRNCIRPVDSFWKQIEDGNYSASVAELEAGWFISDRRRKPKNKKGQQVYGGDDYMERILKHLRSIPPHGGGIEKYPHVPPDSRFGASAIEIEEKILPIFKGMSGAKGIVRTRKFMETIVRKNVVHPWPTNSMEWYADSVNRGDSRLAGGNFGHGGFVQVRNYKADYRRNSIGFSPVVFFPTKPK